MAHHVFVRSFPTLPLPFVAFNWSESQYSDWIDVHTDADVCLLLRRCLDAYAEDVKRKGEKEFCIEYPVVRSILDAAGQ
jgi:conserved oligomeric Golgi complex subunit 5